MTTPADRGWGLLTSGAWGRRLVVSVSGLTFAQNKQHIDFSRHGQANRVGHLQTCDHVVLVASPAAHFASDLQTTEVSHSSVDVVVRQMAAGVSTFLVRAIGFFCSAQGLSATPLCVIALRNRPLLRGDSIWTDTHPPLLTAPEDLPHQWP